MDNLKVAHLTLIQNIISRMGQNSFLLKGWAVTICVGAAAIIGTRNISAASYAIVAIFWALDAYYLHLERRYRDLYNTVAAEPVHRPTFGLEPPPPKSASSYLCSMLALATFPVYVALGAFIYFSGTAASAAKPL